MTHARDFSVHLLNLFKFEVVLTQSTFQHLWNKLEYIYITKMQTTDKQQT